MEEVEAGRSQAPQDGRRLTISQLARELGLSKSATSYALRGVPLVSPETTSRVQKYARERGWRPNAVARALSLSRSDNVGLVLMQHPHTFGAEAFYMEAIGGIESVLSQYGKSLVLRTVTDPASEPEVYEDWGKEGRVDGVILFDLTVDDARPSVLGALQLPYFVFGEICPDASAAGQLAADESKQIVDHIQGLGHTHLLFIGGPQNLVHEVERRRSLSAAGGAAGITVSPVDSDYSLESGKQRVLENLDTVPFTAVVASNDLLAVGALEALRSRKRRGVAVVSWDDSVLCQYASTPVTALERHVYDFGRMAAGSLLEQAYSINASRVAPSPSNLNIRASSRKAVASSAG